VSSSGSGPDDRPLPLWPTSTPGPQPPPPAPSRPAPSAYTDEDGWPDPPGQVWPEYQPPARRRRTLPIVVGGATALVLLVAAAVVGLVLLKRPSAPTAAAGAPPTSAAPVGAAPSPAASGTFAKGDCLEVTSTAAGALDNAKRTRQDCTAAHFAMVVATGATAADCPANTTVSRIAGPDGTLCLGQDPKAAIARPGDCVRVPTTFALPLIRTDCATSDRPFRLEAIVDDAGTCPTGTRGAPYSGYDRVLCVRFPA
jgi:hypothetical protein